MICLKNVLTNLTFLNPLASAVLFFLSTLPSIPATHLKNKSEIVEIPSLNKIFPTPATMRFTFLLKLKLDRLFSKLRSLKGKREKYSEFESIETILPYSGGSGNMSLRELSVIMEADELDEMGIDWNVDSFGTMFWDLDGKWVEGWFGREYGFTAL